MSDMVRCPSCRGAKRVPKLGGMIGDCSTCDAKGKIKACDKPVPVVAVVEPVVADIVEQVAEVIAITEPEINTEEKRKALYKRKTVAK